MNGLRRSSIILTILRFIHTMDSPFDEQCAVVCEILLSGPKTAEQILIALQRLGTQTDLSQLNTFLRQAVNFGAIIYQNKNYSLCGTASTQKPIQIPTSTTTTGMMTKQLFLWSDNNS